MGKWVALPLAALEALMGYAYLAVTVALIFYVNKLKNDCNALAESIGEEPPEFADQETFKELSAKAEKLKKDSGRSE